MVKKLKKPSTQPTKQSAQVTKKLEFDVVQLKKASVAVKEDPTTTKIQDMEKVEN